MSEYSSYQSGAVPVYELNRSRFTKQLLAFWAFIFLAAASYSIAGEGKDLTAETLFQTERLVDVQVTIPEDDWKALTAQTRNFMKAFQNPDAKPFTYFKGDITIDGETIKSVGIRKKGFIGSLDNYRPSLKIKFDEYIDQDPVEGLDRLTLNNNKQDTALVSQFLTYRTFREAGLPAPRVGFARVTVNGEYLGIYSNVEAVRKPFLKNSFSKSSGTLYEGTLSDLYPKAIHRMEVKRGKSDATNDLLPLAELLAAEGDLDLAKVSELVDVPNFLRFLAVETLIGFWDGYANNQNNYFIYQNPENNKYYFVPWGADGAFDSGRGGLRRMAKIDTAPVYAEGMLANRIFWAGDTKEEYVEVVQDLLTNVWKEEEMRAEIDRVEELISSDLHDIQAQYEGSLDQVKAFIDGRREQLSGLIAAGWETVPKTPRKPMYVVPVGTAEGTFATVWSAELGQQPGGDGSLKLHLVIDGDVVEFSDTSSDAGPAPSRGFGRRGGPRGGDGEQPPPPVSLRLTGKKAEGGEPVTLNLTVDRDQFENVSDAEIEVSGFLQQGRGGFGRGGRGIRSIGGYVKLAEAGVGSGDEISGVFKLDIVETRGGMFNRR